MSAMYDEMAQACGGARVWVRCEECKRHERVDTVNALRHGWPMCHGLTMSLAVQKKKAKRKAQ